MTIGQEPTPPHTGFTLKSCLACNRRKWIRPPSALARLAGEMRRILPNEHTTKGVNLVQEWPRTCFRRRVDKGSALDRVAKTPSSRMQLQARQGILLSPCNLNLECFKRRDYELSLMVVGRDCSSPTACVRAPHIPFQPFCSKWSTLITCVTCVNGPPSHQAEFQP
ncbi:hypothetical protein VNO77_09036 [Canavalia gladiata]|uniref:Uncharacterized protein n=1 Tax=Canavalia gladiata TaxID=3824 RepID=A0AAN9QWD9_CANGL